MNYNYELIQGYKSYMQATDIIMLEDRIRQCVVINSILDGVTDIEANGRTVLFKSNTSVDLEMTIFPISPSESSMNGMLVCKSISLESEIMIKHYDPKIFKQLHKIISGLEVVDFRFTFFKNWVRIRLLDRTLEL